MNIFTSVFKTEFEEYLALRKKTLTSDSYKYAYGVLGDFDRCLKELNADEKTISEEIITVWIRRLSKVNAKRTVSNKVACLRKFLEYLRYSGFVVFIPRCPKYSDDYVPYLFSDTEMELIFYTMDTAQLNRSRSNCRYTQVAFPMLMRLLYGCGLRLGETLRLRVGDVNFERGTLLLRQAKNRKQRIVPMHETLTKILLQYCVAMELADQPGAFLFPGAKLEQHISRTTVLNRFKSILKLTGIYLPPVSNERGQCLHCLRHLFAIKSFAQAEQNGRSTSDSVPYLSVYLGHYDMDGTEKYLKFSSDMFPKYTEFFEVYSSNVFSDLGGAL